MQRIASPPPEPRFRPAPCGRTIAAYLVALSCAAALGAASKSLATKPRQPVPLPAALDSQVRSARQVSKSVGVHVLDLDNGGTVYSWDADTPKIIASNTKLFTTAAALDTLGPDYSFETRLLINGKVESGVLDGDLAVIGGGDPNLSGRDHDGDPYAVFAPWAAALRERGIARVRGRLVLVHGLFDDAGVHPDWPRDQLTHWYEAPVRALSFSDNCVLVKVSPGRGTSAAPVVELVPDLKLFKLRNLARTTDSRRRHVVAVSRAEGGDEIRVSGYIWRKSGTLEAWVAVRDPVAYFAAALRTALELQGIAVEGADEPQPALPVGSWEVVYDHRSGLQRALEVTNKRSQNFFAESLFKLLGAVGAQEGSWPGGARAVGDFLDKVGIPRGAYSLVDGSGLSRNDRFAPSQITRLLAFMFQHPSGGDFMRSLAYSGEDGLRWERRLATPPYRGNVFAKTGTLNGVSSLSGYAKARSGKVYAFSIVCNGTPGAWRAQRTQDSIVRALIDNG
jgi:D-alanyl-D-alanine carboxypeptidase/D-alanyl-D-alanine-endopeptidase (penicillin-binding protein 4)